MPLSRINPSRLESLINVFDSMVHAAGPSPIFAISSDEPLIQREVHNSLRGALDSAGFSEKISEQLERGFDWNAWVAQSMGRSLFSEKRSIELHVATGKPGVEGSRVIQAWCNSPAENVALTLTLPRADKAMASSSWYRSLEQHGQILSIQEVPESDRPQWIANRLAKAGLSAEPKAVAWLAHRCEGNLTAAAQEVEKLAHLPRPPGQEKAPISLEVMQSAITDQARFNPFQLGETLVAGSASRSLRMIRGLREEGEPLPILIWSAANACRRLPEARAREAMRQIALIDTMAKGLSNEQDPWVALERLALFLDQPNSPY